MLFAVITGPTVREAQIALDQAIKTLHGIELRLDLFEKIDLNEVQGLIKSCPIKTLLTLRPTRQGGKYKGSEEERLNLLESLCALNPDYVDLEYDIPGARWKTIAEKYPDIAFICSYHDFDRTPRDLVQLFSSMVNPYAKVYKIAAMAHSTNDAISMLRFVQNHCKKWNVIGISMGEEGAVSRILGQVAGNYFDYASIGEKTAPGQISASEMQSIYHYSSLNPNTSLYGLIGHPVDKSLGHRIHNAVFASAKANAVYVKMPVRPSELSEFMQLAKQLPFQGISVTMPLKEAVLPFLDETTDSARRIGAVNTLELNDGKWIGHNTYGIGALNAIESKISVKGKKLVVLGAGGAAKAIVHEAVLRGADVTVVNRTASKAEQLAGVFQCKGGGFELFPQLIREGYAILINCIPEGELIDDQWILPGSVVMDIVYVPKNTPLLLKASEKNCTLVYGYEMFVEQAIEQQLIWMAVQDRAQLKEIIKPIVLAHC